MSPASPARIARTPNTALPHRRAAAALVAIAVLFAVPASAEVSPPGRNVESFLEIARERNPEIASMRLDAAAARERPESAGALPDPTLRVQLMNVTNAGMDANPNLLPSRIGATKYTVMQMLPWFGKRDAMRGAAEADAQAAASREQLAWTGLSMRIKTAYAQYYLAVENEKLTRDMLDLMVHLESVAQVRYAGGLAAQQDAIRAQVEQTTMRTDLVMLASDRRRAEARLNALVARPTSAPLAEPERIRPLPSPARLQFVDLEARARERNPMIAAEEARARSAERMVELADLNRYPDFSVGVTPTQIRNRIADWELMFEVNIPLQQDSRRAKEREARAMLEAARARHEAAAVGILGELSENLAALEAARRTEALAGSSLLPQANVTFQSALAAYENGKVDFATLLDAQRQILRAKQARLKAQAEAQMRLADIERIVGEDL